MSDDHLKESPGMSVAEWNARKRRAFQAFVKAYAVLKKERTYTAEREVAKALVECVEAENMSRGVFKQAFVLMDELVDDQWPAWARLFRDAIDAGVPRTPIWQDLKRCYRADGRFLVVMTKAVPAEAGAGPEEIRFYGDTRGLLASLCDGVTVAGALQHMLSDGANVFFIPTI